MDTSRSQAAVSLPSKEKGKTLMRDIHTSFQHSPYSCPPSSISSASSTKTGLSSTKMASLMNVKSLLSPQFEELDCQSEVLVDQNTRILVSHATL